MIDREKDWQDKVTKLQKDMSYLLTHDSITGLPNRALFYDRLDMAIIHAQRNRERFAIMIIDLDDFKKIIHVNGHLIGENLLREAGVRLKKCVRKMDTVAYLGGDEFAIVLPAVMQKNNTIKVARIIIKSFQDPLSIDGKLFTLTGSIGISIFPEHGDSSDELLKNVDIALYYAKDKGKNNFQFYSYTFKEEQ